MDIRYALFNAMALVFIMCANPTSWPTIGRRQPGRTWVQIHPPINSRVGPVCVYGFVEDNISRLFYCDFDHSPPESLQAEIHTQSKGCSRWSKSMESLWGDIRRDGYARGTSGMAAHH
ncbi:hypothetical protein QBC43DRAFT_46761 [Cladorrhinum sp. PSN259]|nr:hypothetical protein QBC43DRAFT_46761 [Cladorrhinum sp. PSN259]